MEFSGEAVKARGYWELIWIRFRRDRLALASIGFIILLILMAFVGGPVFLWHVLSHTCSFWTKALMRSLGGRPAPEPTASLRPGPDGY